MMEPFTALNNIYAYLPGTYIAPLSCAASGLAYGVYRYARSFQYLYYYYIEHGIIICWTDNFKSHLKDVCKKYKLNKHYDPFGYIGGLVGIGLFAAAGLVIGSLWPISAIFGILTIPSFVLRHVAKEKRAKAIFEQSLKGEAKA